MEKLRIMSVFGTRPEAIKMAPLVKELEKREEIESIVCVTAQHREMLEGALAAFGVTPDYRLFVMREGQSLTSLTARVLEGVDGVLGLARPSLVLVHGDTTTALGAALAAFYRQIPVGHVEAGLRTYRMDAPFPEELNRRGVGLVADLHFAPTEGARRTLLREGVAEGAVFVTGNTVVDALKNTVKKDFSHPLCSFFEEGFAVLLTVHRRESLGAPLEGILRAVRRVAESRPNLRIICPAHKNPLVEGVVRHVLGGCQNIRITDPLGVVEFHNLLARCHLVLTDSGGIQEEAAALSKPTLVLRDTTERPEGVASGSLRLVGTEESLVASAFSALLDDPEALAQMASAPNPYGDGNACRRIAKILESSSFFDEQENFKF